MDTVILTPMVKALCWALIHSLWIGLLAALLAIVIILCTQKASAALRYRLLCAILLLFLIGVTSVFYKEMAVGHQNVAVHVAINTSTRHSAVINLTPADVKAISTTVGFIDREMGWLFLAWSLCLVIRGSRLISGLLTVRQLSSKGAFDVPAVWQEKVRNYSINMGITRPVRLLRSAKITVPATVGFLRPVILLPMDLLFQLPPGQTESILRHELAHIARRDYLVGLFQEIIETIFFFNPALLWLSELIREEREKCCDDIVIANMAGKGAYMEALLSFQDVQPSLILGAGLKGLRKEQLRNRLNRLIGRRVPLFGFTERFILLTCLIFMSGLLLMSKPSVSQVRSGNHKDTTVYIKRPRGLNKPDTLAKRRSLQIKRTEKHEIVKQLQPALTDQQRIRAVIATLIDKNVIANAVDVQWFGLSDTELIVNGEKQPVALQQKLKMMVSVGPDNGLYFGPVQMTGKGVFFEKNEL